MKACFDAAKTWMQVSTSSNTVAIKITFFILSDAFVGYISCDELIYLLLRLYRCKKIEPLPLFYWFISYLRFLHPREVRLLDRLVMH